jgi:hypothetical protein
MPKVNYEERFYVALKRITSYMTPAQLRRAAERQYGLDHAEALEMAYENVIGEAKHALRGYRKPKVGSHGNSPLSEASPSTQSEAP